MENKFIKNLSLQEEFFLFEEEITEEQYKDAFLSSNKIKQEIEKIPTDIDVFNSIDDLDQWVYDHMKKIKSRLTMEDFYVGCDVH
ncbi:MAG: hypothetical protein WCI91_01080 [Candidatus Nomurabacteria bacterium]